MVNFTFPIDVLDNDISKLRAQLEHGVEAVGASASDFTTGHLINYLDNADNNNRGIQSSDDFILINHRTAGGKPTPANGLVGFTRANAYQLDAFMDDRLDKVLKEIIEELRGWSELSVLKKIAYGWASGITARNQFIQLAVKTIIDKLSWLDHILSKFPI